MSAQLKIEEAQFFLELLDTLDKRNQALTHIGETSKEASFLFSAVLNAFYSAMAIMRDEEGIDVKSLVDNNPEIYARAKNGGERAKTVHVSHTLPSHSGYIPPRGDQVNFDLRETPIMIQETIKPGEVNFTLGANHYMYIQLREKLVDVTEFCYEHYYTIREFYKNQKKNLTKKSS